MQKKIQTFSFHLGYVDKKLNDNPIPIFQSNFPKRDEHLPLEYLLLLKS